MTDAQFSEICRLLRWILFALAMIFGATLAS